MKQSAKTLLLFHTVESFFTTWALMKASRMEPGNILTGAFFLLAFFLYRHIHSKLDQKSFLKTAATRRTALILSMLFTSFYMIVDYEYYIETLTNKLFKLIILSAVFLGFLILFYKLLMLLFSYTGDRDRLQNLLFELQENPAPTNTSRLSFLKNCYRKHPAICSFFLCLLCWLPYFLYQYPGIMTPDSINQFEQVLGLLPYSNHHPVAHTLLIKLLYNFGLLFTDSRIVAISFYTFFQMCALAFSVSFFIQTLRLYRFRSGICLILTLFYALVPYHAVFSVTLWKDILFAAALLVFGCCLLRLTRQITPSSIVWFLLSGIMLCLFRSNGWYGFLLCFPFLVFYFRKKARIMYPALFGILLTAIVIKYPLMNARGVIQPDLIESLSIPTQQIAAVICNDRPLTAEQLALIEEVIDLTYIKELYNPTFADNMKELVRAGNQTYLEEHKGEFLKLWITLGLKYPGDYLKAYVKQTYGYFYPDSFYLVAEAEGISGTHLGVSHTPPDRRSFGCQGKGNFY